MAFVRAASVTEVGEGEVLGVEVEGLPVALARVEDEVYAFADKCSHRDFPLSHGELDTDECSITCEWHGAQFDILSGFHHGGFAEGAALIGGEHNIAISLRSVVLGGRGAVPPNPYAVAIAPGS